MKNMLQHLERTEWAKSVCYEDEDEDLFWQATHSATHDPAAREASGEARTRLQLNTVKVFHRLHLEN